MKNFKKLGLCIILLSVGSSISFAQDKLDEKIQKSIIVLKEFANMEESIPAQLMEKAEGIVIIPTLIKAGLGIGGQRGKGVAMMKNANGTWSDPVFVTLTGGSFGFQAGVQAIDLVMIFTKGSVLKSLSKGEFTLGGDIGVAAGPLGRSSSATTDTKFESEVYSYSRSKGLFAGLALNGSKLSPDETANSSYYSAESTPSGIFENENPSSKPDIVSLKKALNIF